MDDGAILRADHEDAAVTEGGALKTSVPEVAIHGLEQRGDASDAFQLAETRTPICPREVKDLQNRKCNP